MAEDAPLSKDAQLSWKGGFPYDVLAEFGITPDATMEEVQDVDFHMPADRVAATRNAVFELDKVQNRLVVDFFLYQGDVSPHTAGDEHG